MKKAAEKLQASVTNRNKVYRTPLIKRSIKIILDNVHLLWLTGSKDCYTAGQEGRSWNSKHLLQGSRFARGTSYFTKIEFNYVHARFSVSFHSSSSFE